MKKKVLITGATGFLGSNIYERLKDKYDVTGVGFRNKSDVYADLTRKEDVERVVKGQDVIIQMAATSTGVKDIIERPYIHVTDNAVMNSLLLRSAFENNVKQFIFPSCTNVYPSSDKPHKETDPTSPNVKYSGGGGTKIYLENMCNFYSGLGRTKHTVMRHSNIYGPNDNFDLATSHVFAAKINEVTNTPDGESIVIWGDGKEKRDFLYVSDFVDFVEIALEKELDGVYNVGSGEQVPVNDLTKKIINASGKNLKIEHDTTKPTIKMNLSLDCTKANEIGWSQKVPLEEGIVKTLDWYSKNSSN